MMSSEKERMLKGEMYNSRDTQLSDERDKTRTLMKAFNATKENEKEKRMQIIGEVIGSVGSNFWIEPPVYIEYGKNTTIGNTVFINYNTVILDVCPVTIGDFVLFGPAVQVYAAAHPLSPTERLAERRSFGKPIEIGSDVWVGGRAIICPGVKIGQGSVIGAGSVVTEDIPPYSLGVGNPCRVIKSIDESYPKTTRCLVGTEKERMLKGYLYNALDPELCELRDRARTLAIEFNSSSEDEHEKRKKITNELFGEVGEGSWVQPPFLSDYGLYITLGKNVHIHSGCCILDVCPVSIGDNTILERSVQVYPATHPLRADERRSGLEYGKPITIGCDVFVGSGAILCPGVKIGDGAVIGAGSVVSRDIPPNVLAAGNPCRVIQELNKS